mmetsp:Transcript_9529/g.38937  ORF Transcript_9529/g.38937 Transcript_9529/m.38937 type:complete len:126 (-) Transcript_9529:67-444(-)
MIDEGQESGLASTEVLGSDTSVEDGVEAGHQPDLRSQEQLEDEAMDDFSAGSDSQASLSAGGVRLPPCSSFLSHGNRAAAIRELERLNEEQLVERIRQVEEWSDILRCAEAYEIQRGMALNIFDA